MNNNEKTNLAIFMIIMFTFISFIALTVFVIDGWNEWVTRFTIVWIPVSIMVYRVAYPSIKDTK